MKITLIEYNEDGSVKNTYTIDVPPESSAWIVSDLLAYAYEQGCKVNKQEHQ